MLRSLLMCGLAAIIAAVVDATGVCYTPFHAQEYYTNTSGIHDLLVRDFTQIATLFPTVRTYHAQFYGENVIYAAKEAGLQIAIGIQMVGSDGAVYEYLEDDIQAAIYAATNYPDTVIAIYAGNENLLNGGFGTTSAQSIIEVITRVKTALADTAGANIPVGTVQRLTEWVSAADASTLAAACDIVGANIYPFFTTDGETSMLETLQNSWTEFSTIYGDKARLTETGWPSSGSVSDTGNYPSAANAETYFNTFVQWTEETAVTSPFYFSMFDFPWASGSDYEQHFGLATSTGELKFTVNIESSTSSASNTASSAASTADENRSFTDQITSAVGSIVDETTSAADSVVDETTSAVGEIASDADTVVDPTTTAASDATNSVMGQTISTTSDAVDTAAATSNASDSAVDGVTSAASDVTIGAGSSTDVPVSNVDEVVSAGDAGIEQSTTPSGVSDSTSSFSSSFSGPDAGSFDNAEVSVDVTDSPSTAVANPSNSDDTSGSATGAGDVGDNGFNNENISFGSFVGDSSDEGSGSSFVAVVTPPSDEEPEVGDEPVTIAPAPVADTPASSTSDSGSTESERAKAERAREVSGGDGGDFTALATVAGIAGCCAIVVATVYMKRQKASREAESTAVTFTGLPGGRESTPSVYSDPLNTRFSSIVMITPNGDGVCIL